MPIADAVLAPFRGRGRRALMLGHVHPDADVLGTLLALDLALVDRGWSVVSGGPHPAPEVLSFLPGIERYRRLDAVTGPLDVVVLTDCPNPGRTEGLIDQARATGATIVNVDHHHDNRRYGDVKWVEPAAAATGEMRSEEQTSELQSLAYLVCRLLLEKKKNTLCQTDILMYPESSPRST